MDGGLIVVVAVICGVAYGFYSALNKFGQLLGWVEKRSGNDWAGNVLLILWVPFLMFLLAEVSKGVSVATNVTTLSTCPHPGPAIQRTWYCVLNRTEFDDWRLRNQGANRDPELELERKLKEYSDLHLQRSLQGIEEEGPRKNEIERVPKAQSDLEFARSLRALASDVSAPVHKPSK
jgi:hypothetical protein